MPFVQVDPSALNFDKPGASIGGFVPVDPSQIKFDAPVANEQPSYFNRLGADIQGRAREAAPHLLKTGALGVPAAIGNVVYGSVNDAVGEGIKSLPPGVTQPVLNAAQGTANVIDRTAVGRKVGDALLYAEDKIKELAAAHPETAYSLSAIGNTATAIPVLDAAAKIPGVVRNMAKGAEGMADAFAQKYPNGNPFSEPAPGQPITRSMVKQASQNAYKAVEDSGTVLNPSFTDKALSILENAKQKAIAGKVLTSENADINAALGEYADLKGSPLTLSDYQQIDSTLGDKAAQAYISGNTNKARIIGKAQDDIRALIKPENLNPADITGNPEGINALTQHAIPLWSTQSKMGDIEKIINRANAMDNPSTAMKTGFRNLMLNEGKMAQYPAQVQKLIMKAAKTGKIDDLLGILGSRLNPIIAGAVGGPHGAVIGNVTSMAGRTARTALKTNQADAVLNALVENVRPSIEKFSDLKNLPLKQIMQLPPQQAKAAMAARTVTPRP